MQTEMSFNAVEIWDDGRPKAIDEPYSLRELPAVEAYWHNKRPGCETIRVKYTRTVKAGPEVVGARK